MAFHPLMSLKKRLAKLHKGPVTVQRLGATWQLYPRDWIDNRLFIGRAFETEQLDFAESIIKDRDIDVFFDCGSNIGLYSVLLAIRVPDLKPIHAFEPVCKTFTRLQSNVSLNQLQNRVYSHNYGLGDSAGPVEIALNPQSSGTATLSPLEKANPKRQFSVAETIDIRVFDQEFPLSGKRSFFKIDVEGFEIQTLSGMADYLARNDCVLQIEALGENEHTLLDFMARQGYAEFHRIGPDIYFEKA